MTVPSVGPILYRFFEEELKLNRALRPVSVHSYRDTLRLFLGFVAQDTHHKITRLTTADLTAERVRKFLQSLETERHNHIRTRNQRLAALHTFFEYLARQVPEALAEAERIAAVPMKRVSPPETLFLERDEIDRLFANLPANGRFALRDRALLLFLYNTGARVQETADLRVHNLQLHNNPRVHLHGKGEKWRVCPLWEQTAKLLTQLLAGQEPESHPDTVVFGSLSGKPLTRSGIYKIVRQHTRNLGKKGVKGEPRMISPHVFRHTTAVHLLEAGVDVNVIRGWLGHVSLQTTNRYAEINLRMKREALAICEPPLNTSAGFPQKPIWRDDPNLLKWLQSL